MSDTYFSRTPVSPEAERLFDLRYGDESFPWCSSAGIFARDRLDPGTRLLLDVSAELKGERVLDLGCGHGALGLLHLWRQGHGRGLFVDVNPRACRATEANRRRLGLSGVVFQADGAGVLREDSVDLLLTNPPIRAGLEVIRGFWREGARVLSVRGVLAFVGRPRQGGRRLAELAARELGTEPVKAGRRKGYEVFVLDRRGSGA